MESIQAEIEIIQIAGEIDIQEIVDGRTALRDSKTASKSPVKTLAADSLQLSAYALAVRQLDGEDKLPMKVSLDYIVQTPAKKLNRYVQLSSARDVASLAPVLARVEVMAGIIKSGNFTPAPVDSWYCSARWCDYHSVCKYAAHPVTVAEPAGPTLEQQLADSIVQAKAAKA